MSIIAKEKFPSRRAFRQRFDLKLDGMANLFGPISESLAEEAESFINELWLNGDLSLDRKVIITSRGESERDRHYCPHCWHRNIYKGYNFCPKCGAHVIFQSDLKKVG